MIYTDEQEEQIPRGPQGIALWPFACALSVLYLLGPVFPTLTQEFWVPGTTHGRHKSKNYLLWFPACLPLSPMCEICYRGMCRALADGKLLRAKGRAGLPTGQNVAGDMTDCHAQGVNKHWGSDYRFTCSSVTLHGFTVVQTWKEQQQNAWPHGCI